MVSALMSRTAESAKWFMFAVKADDARRARYGRAIDRLHRAEIDARRAALELLAEPAVAIPADVGHVTVDDHALGDVSKVVDDVQRIRQTIFLAQQGDGKPYLIDYPVTQVDASSPLLEFALDERVVAPATRYLGMVPILTGITVLASPYVVGEQFAGSQLFHSDWEDCRQVKVFVHCSDVALENGPLTAVSAAGSTRVKTEVDYHYGGPSFRLRDEQVLPRVGPGDVTPFTGATGSATLIDTSSCLHFGSRLQAGAAERLVVQFQFLTPSAFDLLPLGRGRPFAKLDGTFPPLARLVLGAARRP